MEYVTVLGFFFYVLSLLFVLVFSFFYIGKSKFMPYHEQVVGVPWEAIDVKMRCLILALMRVAGYAWLSWFFSIIIFYFFILNSSYSFLKLILFQLSFSMSLIPPVVVAANLKLKTGADTPVLIGSVIFILSLLGFFFTLLSR